MNYKILEVPALSQAAYIEKEVKGIAEAWRLGEGERMGDRFPAQAAFPLSKEWKGMRLTDFIPNKFSRLIVSERARRVLEGEPNEVEWLPVSIIDKKDRVVASPYSIAHILGTVDCVDLKRSEYDRSKFAPDKFLVIRRLVLHSSKIPREASVFRIKQHPRTFIISMDLIEKFESAGLTGFSSLELDAPVMI
jgi:hypothetical protein